MPSASRPWWQQATALVSLGAGGAITGFSFVPRPAADLTSPSSMPVGLMALEQSAQAPQADNHALRSAIINVANYYLRMAQSKSAAEMEAIIWQRDSVDGVDHGESCAAFASLTLELGANVVGQQSWVTGGGSYPWPLHKWADVRVNANPGSPGVTSIVQDAQAHQRWHAMGDGYQPQPGDWVVFDGHVEVVTSYAGGVLHTIGGDSVPNFSVNAHEYGDPLSAQGVLGFVDNGDLPATTAATAPAASAPTSDPVPSAGALSPGTSVIPGMVAAAAPASAQASGGSAAAIPGTASAPGEIRSKPHHPPANPGRPSPRRREAGQGQLRRPGQPARRSGSPAMSGAGVAGGYLPGAGGWTGSAMADTAAIPGLPIMAHRLSGHTVPRPTPQYRRHSPAPTAPPAHGTSAQQAFIDAVAPAAVAAQRKYGVPASVTIAQAIDESGWGQSNLAVNQHNLFGIKGTGPAGSHQQLTQEYQNGQLVTTRSSFRAYTSAAQSVDDHGRLLATSGYYRQAMAVRGNPNAFAASLTGVYATDPSYGSKIIRLMQQYDLYRYDRVAQAPGAANGPAPAQPGQGTPAPAPTPAGPAPTPPRAGTAAAGASIPGVGTPAGGRPGAGAPAAPATRRQGPPGAAPPTSSPTAAPSATARPRQARGSARPQRTAPSGAAGTAAPRGGATGPAPAASASGSAASGTPGTRRPAQRASAPRAATGQPATGRRPARGAAPRRAAPVPSPADGAAPAASPASGGAPGTASIPGVAAAGTTAAAQASPGRGTPGPAGPGSTPSGRAAPPSTQAVSARLLAAQVSTRPPRPAPRPARQATVKYRPQIPPAVRQAYVTRAKEPLYQAEPLYRDVAQHTGISWQLLAACDWMQCKAREHRSPVRGEKLGTLNSDGTSYRTKSEALEQCADDLATLAWTVYGIDLAARARLSVRDLANVFAAFRWGGLLLRHRTSALEFPYSVAGLTARHLKMRWPNIDEPRAPDKPGGRFRMPFGAVPVVLFLNYPATV